jgi:hypothetical protein
MIKPDLNKTLLKIYTAIRKSLTLSPYWYPACPAAVNNSLMQSVTSRLCSLYLRPRQKSG